jgi:hypothetical protein
MFMHMLSMLRKKHARSCKGERRSPRSRRHTMVQIEEFESRLTPSGIVVPGPCFHLGDIANLPYLRAPQVLRASISRRSLRQTPRPACC